MSPIDAQRTVTGGLLALGVGFGLAACGGEEPGRLPPSDEAVEVTVVEVGRARSDRSFPASLEADETVELATRLSGAVRRVSVEVGDRVRRGDTLVVLDDADIDARIAAAAAQARVAERTFQRVEALAADGAASDQELDEAGARMGSARAALEEARSQATYSVLTAPLTGVVTRRSVDPGDLAAPGRPVLTLAGSGGLTVVADLPSELEGSVAVGDVMSVRHGGGMVSARVSRVAPVLSAGSRRFRVEGDLMGGPGDWTVSDLAPGAFVRVELDTGSEPSLWIPAGSLVRRGQLTGVFTVERGELRLRWIRPGEARGDAVEVLSGLPEGARVVRSPGPGLHDRQPVSGTSMESWSPDLGERRRS